MRVIQYQILSLSLLLSSAVEPLPCRVKQVFLAASTDHYSPVQLVLGRKDCCCRQPSSEGAEVSPSAAQELLGVSGCQHWSSCDPARLRGGVAGFISLMDPPSPPRQGLLGLLSLPRWEQGAESDPAGSGPPSCRHAAARKEHGSVTRMCS